MTHRHRHSTYKHTQHSHNTHNTYTTLTTLTTHTTHNFFHVPHYFTISFISSRYLFFSVAYAAEHEQEADIVTHIVPLWFLEQYFAACSNPQFFASVRQNLVCDEEWGEKENENDKESAIRAKYYYAGGCARWLFEFPLAVLKSDFETHFNVVHNYEDLFKQAGGVANLDSKNHLRGFTLHPDGSYVGVCGSVSQCVVHVCCVCVWCVVYVLCVCVVCAVCVVCVRCA